MRIDARRVCAISAGMVAAVALSAAAVFAQTPPPAPRGWSDGVVWNDSTALPTLDDLARAGAPVLWFSPDEFLLKEGIPAPAALDDPQERVVYYRAARIRTDGKTYGRWKACATGSGCRIAPEISELTIRYMFYYPEDRGFGHHRHDLEVADLKFEIRTAGEGAVVRLVYVAGAAHGVGWYTNELTLDDGQGVVLPLHLFVEEGKHATAPDRDGDGVYTPRRDVTMLPIDAWGVRDRKPFSFRRGTGFDSLMFKSRSAETQVWPEHNRPSTGAFATYRLVHAPSTTICDIGTGEGRVADDALANVDDAKLLRGFLGDKDFCEGPHKPSKSGEWPLWFGGTIVRPFGGVMERLSLAYRYDKGRSGWALGGPMFRVPKVDGWLAARLNLLFEDGPATTERIAGTNWDGYTVSDGIVQADFFYTRSAGKLIDWYASLGLDMRSIRETKSGSNIIVDGENMGNVEGGVHLRFPLPDLWKRRTRIPFVGARIGVRSEPSNVRSNTRLVLELGLGAW